MQYLNFLVFPLGYDFRYQSCFFVGIWGVLVGFLELIQCLMNGFSF